MAFELESMTKVRVLDVRTLAKKDRKPDEPSGAQLLISALLPLGVLAMFDGFLPGMLYRKANGSAAQGSLDGVESAELTGIGEHIKRMPWAYEQTGCTVTIDRGLGGASNITLIDCKVHRVSFAPQQGGSAKVQWTVDALGLSDEVRGKLTGLKATDTDMQIELPEIAQERLDDAPDGGWPFPRAAAGAETPPQHLVEEKTTKAQRKRDDAAKAH